MPQGCRFFRDNAQLAMGSGSMGCHHVLPRSLTTFSYAHLCLQLPGETSRLPSIGVAGRYCAAQHCASFVSYQQLPERQRVHGTGRASEYCPVILNNKAMPLYNTRVESNKAA